MVPPSPGPFLTLEARDSPFLRSLRLWRMPRVQTPCTGSLSDFGPTYDQAPIGRDLSPLLAYHGATLSRMLRRVGHRYEQFLDRVHIKSAQSIRQCLYPLRTYWRLEYWPSGAAWGLQPLSLRLKIGMDCGCLPTEGDDNDRRKRQNISARAELEAHLRRFSCLFYKMYPDSGKLYKSCKAPGWSSVHRVK